MDTSLLPALLPRFLAIAGLILSAAFFSGSETALFSLSRVQRERLSRSARASDRLAVALVRNPRRLIVTVLLGNELTNIVLSSLAAGAVSELLHGYGPVALSFASTAITLPLILVLGEVTPKTVALSVAEAWARFAARPLAALAVVLTPVRLLLTAIAGLITRVVGSPASAHKPRPIDEAEFRALVDAGSEEGQLGAAERKLIHNVFQFGDRTIAEIMTPAAKVFTLSYDLPFVRLLQEVARSGVSRIPIHKGKKDEIVGILFAKDLVGVSTGRLQGRTLKDLLRPPMYVPKTTKCDRLFREFQRTRTHLALVVDEYGRLVGLVTMEDLLVALFGPIREEKTSQVMAAAPPSPEAELPS
ncbi:MAG TPA: hemolysin family protein [Haliangiales bacterium]|nr:hemolysin family protein [Haliangiales bacterium]